MKEYYKMNLVPPEERKIIQCLKHYLAAIYIIDRMNVTLKPILSVDVLDFEKIYRNHHSDSNRRAIFNDDVHLILYDPKIDPNHIKRTYSLLIPRPATLSQCAIRRTKDQKSVGEVIGGKEFRTDDILKLVVFHFMKAHRLGTSLQRQIDHMKLASRRIDIKSNSNEDKFGDDELLLKSLSFLHISDFLLLQATCKRWKNLLSYGLKLFTRMVITSRIDIMLPEDSKQENGTVDAQPSAAASVSLPTISVTESAGSEPPTSPMSTSRILSPHSGRIDEESDDLRSQTMSISLDTAAAVLGDMDDDGNEEGKEDLPPLQISFVSSVTVAKLLNLTIRNITELRLDRVILNQTILEHFYYFSGRLRSLSLGLVMLQLQLSANNSQSDGNKAAAITSTRMSTLLVSPNIGFHFHRPAALDYRYKGRVISFDPQKYRFLNGADIKFILLSCGSELVDLELDIHVGEVRNDVFSYCPNLTSLKVNGLAFLRGNQPTSGGMKQEAEESVSCFATLSQGAVSVEQLAENLQGICKIIIYTDFASLRFG